MYVRVPALRAAQNALPGRSLPNRVTVVLSGSQIRVRVPLGVREVPPMGCTNFCLYYEMLTLKHKNSKCTKFQIDPKSVKKNSLTRT